METSHSLYDIEVLTIDNQPFRLAQYQDKVLLIVNVASQCGFTKQYAGLEQLYQKYKDKRLQILAFPCNQFGQQEPGTEDEIKQFCRIDQRISFPLFAKIEVNGKNASPLFQYLKNSKPGLLGIAAIKWNFTKFLIDKQGHVVKRFAPMTAPERIEKFIVTLL